MTAQTQVTDEELYRRAKDGDRRAFETLYDRRHQGLYRYALHMSGNHAIAEEATHDAFLSLIQPASRFDPRFGTVEAYLYGAVRNISRRMRPTLALEQPEEPVAAGDLLSELIGDEEASALHVAVRELPEAYRDAVILCDLEERTYEEAARIMRCPVGTVRSRLSRARGILAGRLAGMRTRAEAAGD
jgi:RNA polymerase sigma-70 factor (ECF subfamily)